MGRKDHPLIEDVWMDRSASSLLCDAFDVVLTPIVCGRNSSDRCLGAKYYGFRRHEGANSIYNVGYLLEVVDGMIHQRTLISRIDGTAGQVCWRCALDSAWNIPLFSKARNIEVGPFNLTLEDSEGNAILSVVRKVKLTVGKLPSGWKKQEPLSAPKLRLIKGRAADQLDS